MNGNVLYHNYLVKDNLYFKDTNNVSNSYSDFEIENIPKSYNVTYDNDWKYYMNIKNELPSQGWKIHISANINEVYEVLKAASKVLIEYKISFKHLINFSLYTKTNSKNADRAKSGKFIAVYPENEKQFLHLLDSLANELRSFKNGPYILNDKRWKNSNVFYRYGGFSKIYNEKGQLCIKDESDRLIVDQRTPFYQVPEFKKNFDEYLDSINNINEPDYRNNKLNNYEILDALTFSNSGGVYLAKNKTTDKKVIIKEARPNTGFDGNFDDSIQRQKNEEHALKKSLDIYGTVNFIESFYAWEHRFLVEEYIEGIDLQKWLSKNYPIMKFENLDNYKKKMKKFLPKLVDVLISLHSKGIAMGDLQPANIIVTENLDPKLIDFETSSSTNSFRKAGMHTEAFSTKRINNRASKDWYSLKKVIKFCLLPIHSSEEIDDLISEKHYQWIKHNYGTNFYHTIKNLINLCNNKSGMTNSNHFYQTKKQLKYNDFNDTIKKLRKGIIENFQLKECPIPGDIRQYEQNYGFLNFLTGGTGVIWSLYLTGSLPNKALQWIENFLVPKLNTIKDPGLLTGLSGIIAVLYKIGYQKEALSQFDKLINLIDKQDVTLRSGLSGIGLSLIGAFRETKETKYLENSKQIATFINEYAEKNKEIKITDWSAVNLGLIDGWSGVSLFFLELYKVTNDKKYLDKSQYYIKKDLKNTKSKDGVLYIVDKYNRLLPYLSGGSIGLALVLKKIQEVKGNAIYQNEIKSILPCYYIRSTINGGLFEGFGSYLLLSNLLLDDSNYTNTILENLNLFLIDKEDYLVYPSHFGFRLSFDVFSGSAGILIGLSNNKNFLPLL